MKQDWATEAVHKEFAKEFGEPVEVLASEAAVFAVKLLRQRDAQWKRAVKELRGECPYTMPGEESFTMGWKRALDDLIAAMKEGRK